MSTIAMHEATKATNKWLTEALAGWEYHRQPIAHQWSIDDGPEHWTVDSQAREPWVRIMYQAPDASKAVVLRGFGPAELSAFLTVVHAPEVVES